MVFIEAYLGPVRLVRSSRTRSSGQNWTPSTIQTPSRPGSRRTEVGRAKPGGRRPSVAPTTPCADAFRTPLRADVHFLPELSEPVRALLARTRTTTNAQTAPDPEQQNAQDPEQQNAQTMPITIPPSSEGGGAPPRDPHSLWLVLARKIALRLSHWPKWAASSLIGPGAWLRHAEPFPPVGGSDWPGPNTLSG